MPKRWIVNPEVDLVSKCESVGRFLALDYRHAIKNSEVPSDFEDNLEPSGRRFVIIGAKSVPMATAKSVFLCLRLAGAESIAIKAPTEDEAWLIKNVLDYWTPEGTQAKMFSFGSERLRDLPEWNKVIDEATDLVVFGGADTARAFSEFENKERRVYIHGPKFSLGIVKVENLTMSDLTDICDDFGSYYGEGCLSPKFYVLVGDLSKSNIKWLDEAGIIMNANHGSKIEEFRAKLPMAKKSEVVQSLISSKIHTKYVNIASIDDEKSLLSPLYGSSRFVNVQKLSDLKLFLDLWSNAISTIACDYKDEEIRDLLDECGIIRACPFGLMQFPEFNEQFDHIDDFDIYCQ